MTQHTPGPWHWDSDPIKGDPLERRRFRVVARGRTITQVYYSSGDPIAEADLRLIAAAPDLLALAKQYASECAECSGAGRICVGTEHMDHGVLGVESLPISEPCDECADIRKVIAKAESSC